MPWVLKNAPSDESVREPLIETSEIAAHLALTGDEVQLDADMLRQKLLAAERYVERHVGYVLTQQYRTGNVPTPLREAIMMLAAHWYENREAASEAIREVPFGVREIINEYREFSF